MKNDYIGLIFGCPLCMKESVCPFQMFRKEKDMRIRLRMWEAMDLIGFSDKLRFHELCFEKNKL
ncbi:hypothetical protein DWB61_12715 [Ancylomarina euxinus]|uniref:Uncharacterized protein n=1 Tax=Ancylomarina euxinus TaxID=2283627 RepID=A0A425XZ30_9BACT|nr:hypothetical protein DWB61_12715 [Ancylomarina euxinus]